MNAADRIMQAIQKLETLRTDSTQPTGGTAWYQGRDAKRLESANEVFSGEDETLSGSSDVITCYSATDAELIVTLHRTIDPQLAILRRGWDYIASTREMPEAGNFVAWYGSGTAQALDLANAIIGEDA